MLSLSRSLAAEMRPMLALAVPVVLGELGWMAMGVVDLLMVGPLGAEAIGGVSLGRALFYVVGVVGIGILLGLDTLVSQAFGAGRIDECQRWLVHGVGLSIVLAVAATPLLLALSLGLGAWGVDPSVLPQARSYLAVVTVALLPALLFTTFRRYLQAMSLVRPVMLALVSANLVNVVGNWVLIYGNLGAPALGVAGAAWATVIACVYLTAFLGLAVWLHDREQATRLTPAAWRLDVARLRRLVGLGLPAAGQLGLEVGVFALATALAARLDPGSLAAHQIALTAASVTFMVPLGISSAAAVRVGQAIGRRDPAAAVSAGWTALVLGAAFMFCAALAFVTVPAPLVRLFTADPRVVGVGTSLLVIAAVFQLFDGLQVVATGALRGAGDTRTPMLFNLVGHWLCGLPVGYALGFGLGYGVLGMWVGLSVGLILLGAALLEVWRRKARALLDSAARQLHGPGNGGRMSVDARPSG